MSVHRLAYQLGASALAASDERATELSATARGAAGSAAPFEATRSAGAASFESTLADQLAKQGDALTRQTQQAAPKPPPQLGGEKASQPGLQDADAPDWQSLPADAESAGAQLGLALAARQPEGNSVASQLLVQQRSTPTAAAAPAALPPSKQPTSQPSSLLAKPATLRPEQGALPSTPAPASPAALAPSSPAASQLVEPSQAAQAGRAAKAKGGETAEKQGVAEASNASSAQVDHAANERALDALALNSETTAVPSDKPASRTAGVTKAGAEKSAAPAKSAAGQGAQPLAQSGPAALVHGASDAGHDADAESDSGSASAAAGGERGAAAKKVAALSFKPAGESAPASDAKPQPAPASASTSLAPAADSSSAKGSEAAASARAVPFAHEASEDPSLRVSLLPQAAHMKMDLDGAGDLALHLRLQGGVAHVTVAGSAASLVESHAGDLRTALAGQGLTLGQVQHVAPAAAGMEADSQGHQLSQDGSPAQQRDGGEPDEPRSKPAPGAASRSSSAFTIARSIASASGKR